MQDVEGYEPSVLSTAQQLLSNGSVDNVVLEYSPGVYERAARWARQQIQVDGALSVHPLTV